METDTCYFDSLVGIFDSLCNQKTYEKEFLHMMLRNRNPTQEAQIG